VEYAPSLFASRVAESYFDAAGDLLFCDGGVGVPFPMGASLLLGTAPSPDRPTHSGAMGSKNDVMKKEEYNGKKN
jgi:hypothetical protein